MSNPASLRTVEVLRSLWARSCAALAGLGLAACTNLSGIGGGSEFQCKAPDGVPCMSVSGVHANERAQNLPAQRTGASIGSGISAARVEPVQVDQGSGPLDTASTAATPKQTTVAYRKTPMLPDAGVTMGAIRSEPTVIRMWVAPWEDADGDLNDQGYIYLQIDTGRWLIEHNRAQIRREFAPTRAAGSVATEPAPAGKPSAGMSTAPGAKGPMSKDEAIAIGRAISQGAGKAVGAAQEPRP